jgi:hypothetical protein
MANQDTEMKMQKHERELVLLRNAVSRLSELLFRQSQLLLSLMQAVEGSCDVKTLKQLQQMELEKTTIH